jgi:hypothetical protein
MSDPMLAEVLRNLRLCYVHDLNKPKIDHFERAAIIRTILDDHHISIREFARRFNIPKSTVEDWLLFNKITPLEYEGLIHEGMTHTQIYHHLRASKKIDKALVEVDAFLQETTERLQRIAKHKEFIYTHKTRDYCDHLEKSLKLILFRIKEQEKKREEAAR